MYAIQIRCLNPVAGKPSEWLTIGHRGSKESAEREKAWQDAHNNRRLTECRIIKK